MNKFKFLFLILISGLFCSAAAWADGGDNSKTIKQILEKQDQIIRTLEELKAELAVIKVRVTQSQ